MILQKRKCQRGFTIMEMLLALTLFAIVITASVGVFSMGIQIWRRSQGRSNAEQKALLGLMRFGKEVRSMIKTGEETLRGSGDERSISFPALIPVQEEQEKEKIQYGRIHYQWDYASESLCRGVETATDIYRKSSSNCVPVAEHIKNLRFRYWLYNSIGKSYSWFDRWDENEPPKAISISIEMQSQFSEEKNPLKHEFNQTFVIPVASPPPLETEEMS